MAAAIDLRRPVETGVATMSEFSSNLPTHPRGCPEGTRGLCAGAVSSRLAQFTLAWGLTERDGETDFAPRRAGEAFEWFERAAQQGHPLAQVNLGALYVQGIEKPEDLSAAASWFEKAAEQGNAVAQFRLAGLYRHGYETSEASTRLLVGIFWRRTRAAPRHSAVSGGCWDFCRTGIPEDPAKAVEWLAKAAEQDYTEAQRILALCHESGKGVETDQARARWWRRAAEQDRSGRSVPPRRFALPGEGRGTERG